MDDSTEDSTQKDYHDFMGTLDYMSWSTDLGRQMSDVLVGPIFNDALAYCLSRALIPIPSTLNSIDYDTFREVFRSKVTAAKVAPYLRRNKVDLFRFFTRNLELA